MRIFLCLYPLLIMTAHSAAEIYRGPISSSMAGTGAAGLNGAEGALVNPALIPLFNGASVDVHLRDGYADRGQHRSAQGIGAIDNSGDVWFPGAFHYIRTRDTGRVGAAVNSELWHVGLGHRLGRVTLGLSGYYLINRVAGDREYSQINYSLGGLAMLTEGLGLAYVFSNLARAGSVIPEALREEARQTLGVLVGLGEHAQVRLDVARQERENPHMKMAYMVGIESKTSNLFIVRLGYRYDDLSYRRFWTAGLGFDGPRLKVDYSMEKNQEREPGALHSVDLRLVF